MRAGRDTWACALLSVVVALSLASSATADAFTVDEQCTWSGGPDTFTNIVHLGPTGQEFIPDFSVVNRVQFWVRDYSPGNGEGASFYVAVRLGTIYGVVLGTSLPTALADSHEGVAEFDFAEDVPLVAGELYVLELCALDDANFLVRSSSSPGGERYPRGRSICSGTPSENVDKWFVEGRFWCSPVEPSSWGVIKSLYR